jgi:hypothetical protein
MLSRYRLSSPEGGMATVQEERQERAHCEGRMHTAYGLIPWTTLLSLIYRAASTNLGPHTLSFVRNDILSYLDRRDDWVIAWAQPGTKEEVVGREWFHSAMIFSECPTVIPITHTIRLYS